MSASTIAFYILAIMVLVFGVLTVTTRMIFRAAVYLLLALIGVAGIYLIMDMEFIAAMQIIIYVGGIVVLIIFSIFLTHQAGELLPMQVMRRRIPAMLIAAGGGILTLLVLFKYTFTDNTAIPIDNTVENIGHQLLDYQSHGYVFPFEVVSILLLAALIGSIVVAMKPRK